MLKKSISALLCGICILMVACSGGDSSKKNSYYEDAGETTEESASSTDPSDYDPKRGEGKYDESNVTLGELNVAMADKGKSIASTKCFSCHKTTNEKLVGPGWADVTKRRTPHWIMNFITNPDPMIDKDPEVQAQLELCLVRMPNQNLQEDEARSIVEYMRQNDGVK